MQLLVEYRLLDKLKVVNEGTGPTRKLKVKGKFQKCDEQNNNGRTYPRKVLESQVSEIQDKIKDRALVGALDHPPNDAIHLSQASHLITKLWVESNGDVMGEAEILSTPSGKIVEALLNDGVKIGISSRGLGTISELKNAKVVNEDFKLITFDLVSDPSTKGAFPELTEATRLNSEKAQSILSKMRRDKILLTALEQKINEALGKKNSDDGYDARRDRWGTAGGDAGGTKKFSQASKVSDKPSERPLKTNADLDAEKNQKKAHTKPKVKKVNNPKQKKFNFMESKLRAELTEILREGLVKRANKIKRGNWENFSGGKSYTTVYAGSKHKTDKDINKLKARKDRSRFTKSPEIAADDAKMARYKKAGVKEAFEQFAQILKESLSRKSKKGGNQLFNNFNKSNNPKGKGKKAVDGHLQGSKPTKK